MLIEHTADTGISAAADSMNELFEIAAFAMFDIMVDLKNISDGKLWEIEVEASDLDELMVTWLTELLYLLEVGGMVPAEITVKEVSATSLRAEVRGQAIESREDMTLDQIKAVTYHHLKVEKASDGKWNASIIFDV